MSSLLLASVIISIVCGSLFFYLTIVFIFKRRKNIPAETVLLVTAHPDDECMFFGPALRGFVKSAKNVHILCLSSGDHYGHGKVRKEELRSSCQWIGIPLSNITVVQHTLMPDDPLRCWRKDIIASIVLKYISSLSVDTVISFDFYGISGHLNHISIFSGLRHLWSKGNVPNNCRFYILESVNVLRKYSSVLDVPFSYFSACYMYVSSLSDVFLVFRAMLAHRSQLQWFRYLYVMFSRYMIINTLREMKSHPSSHASGSGEALKQE